jgi:poly(hydroxyalkanoate) depolymerase family esterase
LEVAVRSILIATVVLSSCVASADAIALEAVNNFGSNPGNLKMFEHVPAGASGALPLVLVLHGCTQDASYATNSGLVQLADESGVALAVAETNTSNNQQRCFNWFEPGDIARDSGEALSLKQMIDSMKARHTIDASRVFVTGLSAGGAMTAVMLAAYPDVFAAGAVVAGIPYRCGTGVVDAINCMNNGRTLSQQEWADLVLNETTFNGTFPRVSVWHGTSDNTVDVVNADNLVLQWTGVHGIDAAATSTNTVGNFTRKTFGPVSDQPLVETARIAGMDHGTPVDPGAGPEQCGTAGAFVLDVNVCASFHIFRFFGLTGGSSGEGEGEGEGDGGCACGATRASADIGALVALLVVVGALPRRRVAAAPRSR